MAIWYKSYRNDSPCNNSRLNSFILDYRYKALQKFHKIEEVIDYTVQQIVKTYSGPYTLMTSGGIDSQVMIWAWIISGHKFNVVHYKYNEFNKHETDNVINFCKKHKIDYEIKNFDVIGFITSSELHDYAKKYDCISPQLLTHIKFVENHPETVLFAGNYFKTYHSGVNYTIHGLQRFAEITKKNFIPFFLHYTPEIGYAFTVQDDICVSNVIHCKKKVDEYLSKKNTYLALKFPILDLESKQTGFENIKNYFDNFKIDPRLRLKYKSMTSTRIFDIMYRYRLYDFTGHYSDRTTCIFNNLSSLPSYNPLKYEL